MGKKIISGATGAFNFWANGHELDDVTSITLSDIEIPTTEIKGAGIMGALNQPQRGQVSAMSMSVAFRRTGKGKKYFMSQLVINLEVRIATDVRAADGTLYVEGTKIFASGSPTKLSGGKVEPGSTRDESVDIAVTRYREIVDGEETILVDQIANIFRVDGVDINSDVRKILN